jgi:hypothetical protein
LVDDAALIFCASFPGFGASGTKVNPRILPLSVVFIAVGLTARFSPAATLRVPKDHPTIQAAIDAAKSGDVVQVAPGTYRESLKLAGKNITLASDFIANQDRATIEATVLAGGSKDGKKGSGPILAIGADVGFETKVVGFTFFQGDHGILNRGKLQVLHNRFIENRDGLSFESAAAIVRGNVFERNRDDGIDMDGASAGTIEDNIIRDKRDDGLELRLHNFKGSDALQIVIRGNTFSGNGGDGVQLIDYPGKTARTFRIERNLFVKNAMSGIGATEDGLTRQNFQGSQLIEPVLIVNNTFVDSNYGVVGGENMVLLNNVFLRTAKIVAAHVKGDSAAGVNLHWQSGGVFDDCDFDQSTFLERDPQLDASHRPKPGSACIDAGAASFAYNGAELTLAAETFSGRAPDLGAFEIAGSK